MKVACIGGGPAGLYLALLLKKNQPRWQVDVFERNAPEDTFGFGVVFSDATLDAFEQADNDSHEAMRAAFLHWDDIEIKFRENSIRSTGHGFAGLARTKLLEILHGRCAEYGVDLHFRREVDASDLRPHYDLVVAADGAESRTRDQYRDVFDPEAKQRPNRFVWLGSSLPLESFKFVFQEDDFGLWRVHAYPYAPGRSTIIVETFEQTWRRAGLEKADEEETVCFCAERFRDVLAGHALYCNKSVWRQFLQVRNQRWRHENLVLLGDAAHTAHFSIGSGTKLAMEDSIALAAALHECGRMEEALAAYENGRRPVVESFQRAAFESMEWFEHTERYANLDFLQFAYSLLTRSLRVTHEDLRERDPALIRRVETWFTSKAGVTLITPSSTPPPPMFTPLRLRDLVLPNRVVVSPMCQYSAAEGMPNEWHLVHLGSRAVGGAGLVMTEMTDVSKEGRISQGCAGIYSTEHATAWKHIVDFVHEHSRAKIGIQLGHAGRKGSTRLAWEGIDEPLETGGWPIIAPSPLPYLPHSQVPREMDRADMDQVMSQFVRAAQYANSAGFDLLELHFAHGYLLASFISPLTNRRTDEYGGSLQDRLRFPLEVFDAVRKVWPSHKPMSVRISAVDWHEGGTRIEDSVTFTKLLEKQGCDIIDVSTGQTVSDEQPRYGRQYQTRFSEQIRLEAGIPTMAVGNISSYADVNTILAAGRADLCVMARAHLWSPYWTRQAAAYLEYDYPWPDQYATLNQYEPRFE